MNLTELIIYPLPSKTISQNTTILDSLTNVLKNTRISLFDRDVIVISSKIVSISENRLRNLSKVRPGSLAKGLARKYGMKPTFVQIVLDEADNFLGGVEGALLTIVDGNATANSGIDVKNAPRGNAVLWPRNPDRTASRIRRELYTRFRKRVGVLIVDSRVTPLRLGTIGLTIGSSGISPLRDFRGRPDIYGRKIRMTVQAVADGIAAAAQIVMGESDERIPFALVRDSRVNMNSVSGIARAKLGEQDCLYMSQIRSDLKS